MSLTRSLFLVVLAGAMGIEGRAVAQLFPNSTSRGSSISSKSKTTSSSSTSKSSQSQGDTAAPLQGGEWAIQRSHGRGSFVGADARDRGFVGTEQALVTGAIRSAIDNAKIQLKANVNQMLAPRKKSEIYGPQLKVAFDVAPVATATVSSSLARQLRAAPALQTGGRLEVSVEGRIATLRGEVASEGDRDLARQMALFEPGIDEVRNLLTVKPPRPAAPATPAPATQRPR